MLKKYLCGAAIAVALCVSGPTPVSAEELYVRNRAFGDAYFSGGTTYVPVASFLRALDVPWSQSGSSVTLGQGDSPESAFTTETVTLSHGEKTLDLNGMVRGGKLYVPAKNLASFVGYTVIHNSDTGIVDVVKTREYTATDRKAEEEVAASKVAQREANKATRDARIAKEKAYAEAKAKADGKAGADEEEVADAEEGEEEDATDEAPTTTKTGKTTTATTTKTTTTTAESGEGSTDEAADAKPKEAAKANLVVLSSDATPNYYTGDVVFRAVVQNQGFAPAENLTAGFSVTGPDGRNWVTKTLYHGPLAVDGRWEIVENYKHRAASAMPRGNFDVKITPKFTSGAVADKK